MQIKRRNFAALVLFLLVAVVLVGCADRKEETETASYQQITAEEAKSMMEELPDAVVLDVREQDEYDTGHIPGAVLLPGSTINEETAASAIPAKDTVVLVYCRSGNRSKTASQALVDLGIPRSMNSAVSRTGLMRWSGDRRRLTNMLD